MLGLIRSDKGAEQLEAAGAELLRGNVNHVEFINQAAGVCDVVIHTAFNHNFLPFKLIARQTGKVLNCLAMP